MSGVKIQELGNSGIEGFELGMRNADINARCLVLGAWGSRLFNQQGKDFGLRAIINFGIANLGIRDG